MKGQNSPKQSAPVIRHASSATISGEQGVEASGFLDSLWEKAKSAGAGALQGALGALKGN
ncbi:MAG: hypothetical protein F6K14_27080 [Symploca sp. SIO2C1]|nr:hypothetical protein [Symploca sp. SIO2C1]